MKRKLLPLVPLLFAVLRPVAHASLETGRTSSRKT